ncbi:helix-turn-helix transcriptional regulator [Dulcicalothrix desertica PCC 7102]|uniref:Helix-turn-helix transcriptional regulator n=1 Tax=Dulcicalothrix desertica PCC 7102 TaxID=232991 RepID=A0A433VJ43_9CYAN|nr:response regulator transcription factor [Dulcicalothrix desertica]RUT06090.1 helix-turn-helix transcriptional regulator [Dulcicalothrix desertica PCC 7102]TWH54250.1 LuxR family two component transcriptional regulator [Dulcicalothrix desertica PCC 7102]
MIRVLVVAASPIVRAGLATVLAESPKFQVITSGAYLDVLTQINEQQPDVLLLDWNDDREFWDIVQSQNSIPIIVIASNEQLDFNLMLRSGVRGILSPESREAEIILAVETVAAGMIVFHSEMIDYLLAASSLSTETIPTNVNQVLTSREIEVLQLLASGSGNKAIAQNLHISEHTVKFHISSIFQKLNVSTRTQAVAVGIRLGLVML